MAFFDFLEEYFPKWFKSEHIGNTEPIVIEIPASLCIKEMALYNATSLLANAISGCEFKVFNNHKEVKNEDWFRLNVAPNKNENASFFWNKVINRMIRSPNKGALVVEINGELHCANNFTKINTFPIYGDVYGNVNLGGTCQLNRTFRADEVYLFRMEEKEGITYIEAMYSEYGKIFQSAARAFKESNGNKYKLKLDGIKIGDDNFVNDYENYIKAQLETYLKNEYAIYVQYEGYELEKEEKGQQKTVDDIVKLKKDIFETIGQALKIPISLMSGNVTSIKDVCNVFLTFGVDPIAEMIQKTLNKRAGMKEVLKGNYYVANTGKIKHRDAIEDAVNIDKLIGSGFADIDEVRDEEGYVEINEDWSKQHWMTRNYGRIEDVAEGLVNEGGEGDAKRKENEPAAD